ncbi:MAG: hypothetical protein MZW92_80445 [Comamonadaceae bacterium]|nr:hypothetical protein [Comamonadaceae bacterium]
MDSRDDILRPHPCQRLGRSAANRRRGARAVVAAVAARPARRDRGRRWRPDLRGTASGSARRCFPARWIRSRRSQQRAGGRARATLASHGLPLRAVCVPELAASGLERRRAGGWRRAPRATTTWSASPAASAPLPRPEP